MSACLSATIISAGSTVFPAAFVWTILRPNKAYNANVIVLACIILTNICFPLTLATAYISESNEVRESVVLPNLNWHSIRKFL